MTSPIFNQKLEEYFNKFKIFCEEDRRKHNFFSRILFHRKLKNSDYDIFKYGFQAGWKAYSLNSENLVVKMECEDNNLQKVSKEHNKTDQNLPTEEKASLLNSESSNSGINLPVQDKPALPSVENKDEDKQETSDEEGESPWD